MCEARVYHTMVPCVCRQVGEDLVPKILSVSGNGRSVEFLTTDKVVNRKPCEQVVSRH